MRILRLLPLVSLLAFTACDGATLPVLADGEGAVRFDFSGDTTGHFEAVGVAEETPSTSHPWAYALLGQDNWVTVSAFRPHANGNGGDYITFAFEFKDGIQKFDWSNCRADAPCAGGSLFFAYNAHPLPETVGTYAYSDGSIRINSSSSTRIRGEFVGHARAVGDTTALTIDHGTFDVPLLHPGVAIN